MNMRTNTLAVFFLLGCFSCSTMKHATKEYEHVLVDDNTFLLTEISSDPLYGFSPEKSVEVGGEGGGPKNERRFLNALSGPNGEPVSYHRAGSCCPTKSENALFGDSVMLDNYRVTWEGSKDTFSIYINMWDLGYIKAPKGFGIKKN